MAEKENHIESFVRQASGAILDANGNFNGNFSEGSAQKGGVNTAPPCPRPEVVPAAYNKISTVQNPSAEPARNSGAESKA